MRGIIDKEEELDEVLKQKKGKIAVFSEIKKNYKQLNTPGITLELKYKSGIWSDVMNI
jgi:hypothetical protein